MDSFISPCKTMLRSSRFIVLLGGWLNLPVPVWGCIGSPYLLTNQKVVLSIDHNSILFLIVQVGHLVLPPICKHASGSATCKGRMSCTLFMIFFGPFEGGDFDE